MKFNVSSPKWDNWWISKNSIVRAMVRDETLFDRRRRTLVVVVSSNRYCRYSREYSSLSRIGETRFQRQSIVEQVKSLVKLSVFLHRSLSFQSSIGDNSSSSNDSIDLERCVISWITSRHWQVNGYYHFVTEREMRCFSSLCNLRILELRENLLKILPDSLVQLNKLESLDLGSNVIEHLPSNLGLLQALKELWLDSNELSQLPVDLGQLKRLQCLDVSENKLSYLPAELGDLESLTNLELSSNRLESIPASIGRLKQHLLIFKINSNCLTRLCEEIGQCLQLTELILTENTLSELPATIGQLKHLTNLNVDRNQLTSLPAEVNLRVRWGREKEEKSVSVCS